MENKTKKTKKTTKEEEQKAIREECLYTNVKPFEKYKTSHFNKPENFVNRELSWLEFNKRVLLEARDKHVPLFERLKFLSITASNMDEFFMVRVASLKDQVHAGFTKTDIAGYTAKKQLELVSRKAHRFVQGQYTTYNRALVPALEKAGLHIVSRHEDLTDSEAEYIRKFFDEEVYPALTPMAVDASRPFPLIRNKSLNIAAIIKKKGKANKAKSQGRERAKAYISDNLDFAMVQVPSVISRVVEIPSEYSRYKTIPHEEEACTNSEEFTTETIRDTTHSPDSGKEEQGERSKGNFHSEKEPQRETPKKRTVILLEEVIEMNIDKLFFKYEVVCAHYFRIMRNAEFELDEEDAADLLEEIRKQIKKRQRGEAIRLEVEDGIDERLLKVLKKELEIEEEDLFRIKGPLDLTVLMKIYGLSGFEHLKEEKYIPAPVTELLGGDIFECIRKQDVLLSHPYQSFDSVIDFVEQAAKDKDVLAIKQTLYRVSGNSPIVAALAKAAENGKQVTVLVELKARFDEENNINWALKLEKAGCHVIYGLVGLKTHSKITLVVRKEADGIRRYVHLGTGNYNDSTAKLYTDLGVFTAGEDYGEDASAVFNMLSGFSEPDEWKRLIVAPIWMKDKFLDLIKSTRDAAMEGKQARIVAKMNSLSDKDIIIALYKAAAAGVEIDLIVRGICCLRVDLKECMGRIRVRSIVGSFLEHARVFVFDIAGKTEYYLGSADWMSRNLEKRVEVVFPVMDQKLCDKLDAYLKLQLEDNVKASIYTPSGGYEKEDLRGKKQINSQELLKKLAHKDVKKVRKSEQVRVFTPATKPEEQRVKDR